jgi:peptide/nickel transport system permease protein
MKNIIKDKSAWSALFLVIILVLLLSGERFAPYPPNEVDMSIRLQPLSSAHFLGTDFLGRDIFSRILAGANNTVGTSMMVLFACLAVGVPLGLISGYIGGRVDWIIMRLVDASMMFPDYIVAIVLSGLLGAGTMNLIIAIVVVKWFAYARIVRSIVLAEKSKEYIATAKLDGLKSSTILWKHLFPHVASSVTALAVVDIGKIILMIASLSYLGLGVQPPNAEWGSMLNEGRSYFVSAPYLMIVPGLAILLVVLITNIFGNSFANRFDIKNQQGG